MVCLNIIALLSIREKTLIIIALLVLITGIVLAPQTLQANLAGEGSDGENSLKPKQSQSWHNSLFSQSTLLLLLILTGGGILRFKGLNTQSLWLDELHAMIEANPATKWPDFFFFFKCCDFNPPLFYVTERFLFHFFEYTGIVARSLSAVAGMLGIIAIYCLGAEMKSRRVGLIAAALAAVNPFAIYYSQEARPYSLLFLFTTLSYLFFIKVCKSQKIKDTAWYVCFSVCLIYTHYFGLLVIFCEGVIALILLWQYPASRKMLFILLLISIVILFFAYIPWLPYFISVKQMTSYWTPPVKPYFFASFFRLYFGKSEKVLFAVTGLLLFYVVQAGLRYKYFSRVKNNTTVFSFVFVAITVVLSLGIPYIRSVLVVPFLIARFSIIILPSVLIAIASGIDYVKFSYLRYMIIAYLLYTSVYHLVNYMEYYDKPSKTQFREMTAFISAGHPNYPVVNELTAWQQQYYLDLYHNKAPVLTGKKDDIIDSVLHRSSKQYCIDTFWLVGAHGDPHLAPSKTRDLDTAYVLIGDSTFFDAWAQLYGLRKN